MIRFLHAWPRTSEAAPRGISFRGAVAVASVVACVAFWTAVAAVLSGCATPPLTAMSREVDRAYAPDRLDFEDRWYVPTITADCQAYVVAKIIRAQAMGIPLARMEVFVVQASRRHPELLHAILRIDGDVYDNRAAWPQHLKSYVIVRRLDPAEVLRLAGAADVQ